MAVVWTGVALWAYASARRRTPLLLGVDLAIAVGAILLTPLAKGPDFNATIPGFWVMGALLAWAVHWHWKGGLAAAVAAAVNHPFTHHLEQWPHGLKVCRFTAHHEGQGACLRPHHAARNRCIH